MLEPHVSAGRITATLDYEDMKQAHAILIALPTPLTKQREPDLSYVEQASHAIGAVLQPGQLVVLESTTYPGTTREVVKPILEEESGLVAGQDFNLAMSPERVDPGRTDWTTKTTPKVVGGLTPACTAAAAAVYRTAVDTVHEVSAPESAELTKLLENIYRSVNIALVNELAQLCDRMGIDVWEVVDAAATKPFGFQSFQPGPGLGGHCIPLDPYYLSWKAREYDFSARFIELAGEVNNNMPYFCRSVISQALNHGLQRSVSGREDLDPRRRVQGRHRRHARDARREADRAAEDRRRRRQLPRPARPRVRRDDLIAPRAGGLRLRRDRHRALGDRLRRRRRARQGRRRLPQRHARPRGKWEGVEALSDPVRIAQVGLGPWGANLVRNVDVLADLVWICDASEERREQFTRRFPNSLATGSFDEVLADPEVEAVVIATPVPTHYELAKQALEAGKHVFVEKPPAMREAEMAELVELSEARGKVLMPGHLLLYHPGVRKLKELVDSGDLGDVLCIYGNRQNLGTIRKDENALWSLGVHDVSVILHLANEEPSEVWAHGNAFLNPGVEDVVFCFMRFPSGKIAHLHLSWLDPHKMRKLTVVGRDKMVVFDDMELERKVTIYDKWPEQPLQNFGEWQTRTGDILSPKIPSDEPLKLELSHFLRLVREGGTGVEARDGLAVVRVLELLQKSLESGS